MSFRPPRTHPENRRIDRNAFLSPAAESPALSSEIERIEFAAAAARSEVAEANDAIDAILVDLPSIGTGSGAAVSAGFYATVDTFVASSNTGTATRNDTAASISYRNASGFGLANGDVVLVQELDGEFVVIAIYSRAGSYTPIVLNNPQAVTGFPFDGDQLPNPLNYTFAAPTPDFILPSCFPIAGVAAWYGSGILGYTGRVVAFLSRSTPSLAQPTIVFYNVETGASTAVIRTAGVGSTNRSHSIAAVGNRLFVTYDGTTGNCVESYDATTGVWTTHDIQRAVFAGVSDGRAWWVGLMGGQTNPTRWRIISIDSSGTLSQRENPAATTAGTQVFARAKNGKMYYRINTTGALLYNFDANVAAASTTITNSATAPATLPYSNTGTAGSVSFDAGQRAYTLSDIADNGDCYYLLRTGTPTTAGYGVIDETTLAVTTYTQITSSTGNAADGEILIASGLQLAGTQVVLFGGVREDLVTGGSRTTSIVPAYWRTDGVTTVRVDDTEYVGLTGGTGTGTDGFARTTPIHKVDVTTDIVFHTNISSSNSGSSAQRETAKSTGPAYGDSYSV